MSRKLHDVVTAIVEQHRDLTPEQIVAKALEDDSWDRGRELTRLLRPYVTQVLAARRHVPRPEPVSVQQLELVDTGRRARKAIGASANPAISAKIAARRVAAPSWLEERIAVDTSGNLWKRIGDCTRADVQFIIRTRTTIAARAQGEADKWGLWYACMAEHGVEMIRDLPPEVLAATQ